MPTTAHGAPYPSPQDARDVPAHLQALAEWTDAHTTLSATDSADRDARYADLPAGQLVTASQAPWSIWLKAGPGNDWKTVYYDSGWISAGFTPGPKFDLVDCRYSLSAQDVDLYARLTYTGATITAGAAGNIDNDLMVTLPAAILPLPHSLPGTAHANTTSLGVSCTTAGNLSMYDMHPNSLLSNGDTVDYLAWWRR